MSRQSSNATRNWRSLRPSRRSGASRESSSSSSSSSWNLARAGQPWVLLIRTQANRQTVMRACPGSLHAGIRAGMSLAHARALLPERQRVLIEEWSPHRDRQALERLAVWAQRFSPQVAVDELAGVSPSNKALVRTDRTPRATWRESSPAPIEADDLHAFDPLCDGLLLDITGCERLFHGEKNLLELLTSRVSSLGLRSRVAIAPTFAAAWALARFASNSRVIVQDLQDVKTALAPLPITALRLEAQSELALRAVGVERIEHLMSLPRRELAARFGASILLRLDQALGQANEWIDAVPPPRITQVQRSFAGPTAQLEALMLASKQLIEELCTHLLQQQLGATAVELRLIPAEGEIRTLTITFTQPSREPAHWWTLLRPLLERVPMDVGFEELFLQARTVAPLPHAQSTAWQDIALASGDHDAELGPLLDQLLNRLGAPRVTQLRITPSHWPEHAFTHDSIAESPALALASASPSARRSQRLSSHPASATTATTTMNAPLPALPSLLLDKPELIQVIAALPESPPSWLRWRHTEHLIRTGQGPNRLAAPWWCRGQQPITRDYYILQNQQGQWLWVFREQPAGKWYLHGQWV